MRNILIVGKAGTAVEVISKRLLKEGLRVYLLSDSEASFSFSKLKTYTYAYDSPSVYEVFGSCRPDAVLFMGAYDTCYHWKTRENDRSYQAYVAGLANILRVSERVGVQRFVYLSSGAVFGEDFLKPIPEDAKPAPDTVRAKAIAMGETMVTYYNDNLTLDGIIVRFDQMFFCPKNTEECISRYANACLSAVTDGRVPINSKNVHSGLWINDAAQALYLLLTADSHARPLYHITGSQTMSDDELARFIRQHCTSEVQIEDLATDTRKLICLQDNYFSKEFDFLLHFSLEDGLLQILQYMQKNVHHFQKESSSGILIKNSRKLGRKIFPFVEAFVGFLLVFYLQKTYGQSELFKNLDLFLLYILLFSLTYGIHLAVFTDVLSMIGFLILNFQGASPLELLIDVGTYVWIAKIFIVGMSVGHQRDALRTLRADKDAEIHYLNSRLDDITEINNSTTLIKDYFESQVINSRDSLSYFYRIMTRLDNAEDNGLLFEVVDVLKTTMQTDSVAIYRAVGNGYYRLLTGSNTTAYAFGPSLSSADYSGIFDALAQDQIYINATSDANLPSMAGCTRDADNQIEMVLLIWNLPFDQMTLQNRNRFRILCMLIHGALLRAGKYQDALLLNRYLPGTRIFTQAAFEEIERQYHSAAQKELVNYLYLHITSENKDAEQTHKLLTGLFRSVDILGYFDDGTYHVIALNSRPEDADILQTRLHEHGFEATVLSEF